MEIENKDKLYGHICFKTNLWLCSYGRKIIDAETGKEKYPFKYKYSEERMYQYCHKNIDNLHKLVHSDDELKRLIERAYEFCTNEDAYKEWKSEYDQLYYLEKRRRGDELSRAELNKQHQAKRKNRSKNLVLEIATNLKKKDKKVTSGAIFNVMEGLENGIGLTQCKKYLKELRNEGILDKWVNSLIFF